MVESVNRGKSVDFESYLDIDMPAINSKIKKKISGGGSMVEAAIEGEESKKSGKITGQKGGESDHNTKRSIVESTVGAE